MTNLHHSEGGKGVHLRLTSWSRGYLSPEDRDRILVRLASLGARAGVIAAKPGGPWYLGASKGTVHVSHDNVTGDLAAAFDGLLDDLEKRLRFTPEEIMVIASQSGLA